MVGWHHQLQGHESEQAPGEGEGQGTLVCCVHGTAKSQTQRSDWTTMVKDSSPQIRAAPFTSDGWYLGLLPHPVQGFP